MKDFTCQIKTIVMFVQIIKSKQSIVNPKFIITFLRLLKKIDPILSKRLKGLEAEKQREAFEEEITFSFDEKVSVNIDTKADAWFDMNIASALLIIFGDSLELSIDGEVQQLD